MGTPTMGCTTSRLFVRPATVKKPPARLGGPPRRVDAGRVWTRTGGRSGGVLRNGIPVSSEVPGCVGGVGASRVMRALVGVGLPLRVVHGPWRSWCVRVGAWCGGCGGSISVGFTLCEQSRSDSMLLCVTMAASGPGGWP